MKQWVGLGWLVIACAACSEASTGTTDTGTATPDAASIETDAASSATDAGSTTAVDAASSSQVDAANGARDGAAGDAGMPAALVINELAPSGSDEFVEIMNFSTTAVSLGGLSFADSDGLGTPPADPTHVVAMPDEMLAAGARFVVVLGAQDEESGMVATPCPITGVDRCLLVGFGLSASRGDVAALLDATGAEVVRTDLAAGAVTSGNSLCRVPDGVGELVACTPTPGAANMAASN